MKFKEIKEMCNTKGIKLIEFSKINEEQYDSINSLEDFLSISGNIVGYKLRRYNDLETTNAFLKLAYKVSPGFSEWLEDEHRDEIYELCHNPEDEIITLISLKNNYTWIQNDYTDSKIRKIKETIQKYHNEFIIARGSNSRIAEMYPD